MISLYDIIDSTVYEFTDDFFQVNYNEYYSVEKPKKYWRRGNNVYSFKDEKDVIISNIITIVAKYLRNLKENESLTESQIYELFDKHFEPFYKEHGDFNILLIMDNLYKELYK